MPSAPATEKRISWENYRSFEVTAVDKIPDTNVFHGILHYISFNSGGLYNTGEVLVQYSSIEPNSDVSSILNAATDDCFNSGSNVVDCLVFTFARVSVRPSAYMIRSGPWTRKHPAQWSFVFQGWDEAQSEWVTLNERCHELRPCMRWRGYLVDVDQAFRQFRFLYTGVVVPGVPSFSIAAFEIHGAVFPDRDDSSFAVPPEEVGETPDEFDPWQIDEHCAF
jgi:hypothetical protein